MKWLGCLPAEVRPEDQRNVGTSIFEDRALLKELETIDLEYFGSVDSFYTAVVKYVLQHGRAFEIEPCNKS